MTKPKDRSPAMQFYFRQFAGDENVMSMDLDAVGAHILLMCAAGASEHGYKLAYDERALRVRLRNPSEPDFCRIMSQLLAGAWKLSEDGKWIVQHGQRRILLKQQQFSEKQKGNAEKRWGCQGDAKRDAKRVPNPCSSSSSSSSSSSTNKKEVYIYTLPDSAPSTLQAALQAWQSLQREKHNRQISQVEVDAMLMQWAPRFKELEAALIYSTANGWKNIREKVTEPTTTPAPRNGHQYKSPQELKDEAVRALHAKYKAEEEAANAKI